MELEGQDYLTKIETPHANDLAVTILMDLSVILLLFIYSHNTAAHITRLFSRTFFRTIYQMLHGEKIFPTIPV